jgi:hypothetical protein
MFFMSTQKKEGSYDRFPVIGACLSECGKEHDFRVEKKPWGYAVVCSYCFTVRIFCRHGEA